jgi:antitoxin component YwqK of YwqJK toxin-antitoxin module
MMRIVALLFTVLFFSSSSKAQQKNLTIIEGKDTSQYSLIYLELDSLYLKKLIGYFEEYPNQRAIEKSYYLGRQSGKEYTYYPDGSIYEVSIFQNGKRDGDYSKYNVQGELVVKARYLQGDLSGFYINRKEHYQGKYSKGLKRGKWEYNVGAPNYYKEYYKNGVLLQKRQVFPVDLNFLKRKLKLGKLESKHPNEDSLLIPYQGDSIWFDLQYVSQDLLPHPAMRKAYFKDFPKILAHTKYVYNGYVNGTYRVYYPNGRLYLFANYTAGTLDGAWKQFDESGDLKIKGKYLNGRKVGKWKVNIGLQNEHKVIYRSGILKRSINTSK